MDNLYTVTDQETIEMPVQVLILVVMDNLYTEKQAHLKVQDALS